MSEQYSERAAAYFDGLRDATLEDYKNEFLRLQQDKNLAEDEVERLRVAIFKALHYPNNNTSILFEAVAKNNNEEIESSQENHWSNHRDPGT